jgi:hypothetical protein
MEVDARHVALSDLVYALAEAAGDSGDFHPCLADDLGDLSSRLRQGESTATGEAFVAAFKNSGLT